LAGRSEEVKRTGRLNEKGNIFKTLKSTKERGTERQGALEFPRVQCIGEALGML